MSIGEGAIGEFAIGEIPSIPQTQFDIETDSKSASSIIIVTELFGSKLIEHFQKYPDELKTMDRRKFEELVAELFDNFGYEVQLTQRTRDGGKDIIAVGNVNDIPSKYLIECKRPDPGNHIGVGVA